MSLIDKSININASSASVLPACIIEAIYPIIKSIFLNSSIDNDNSMLYFDLEKKNGIGFQVSSSYLLVIKYLINNNQYNYNYLSIIENISDNIFASIIKYLRSRI